MDRPSDAITHADVLGDVCEDDALGAKPGLVDSIEQAARIEADLDAADRGFEEQVRALESKIARAQAELTDLKLSKHRDAAAEKGAAASVPAGGESSSAPGDDSTRGVIARSPGSFLGGGVSGDADDRDSFRASADELLAFETEETRRRLITRGTSLETADKPMRWDKLRDALLDAGVPRDRAWALVIVHDPRFSLVVNLFIVVASLAVGLETDNAHWSHFLDPLNYSCLCVFTLEVGVKLVAFRRHFWTDPDAGNWNRFDFVIVALSLLDLLLSAAGAGLRSGGMIVTLRVLRLLRVLKSLRTLKTSQSLMVLMESIAEAVPATISVLIMLAILFYIYAILLTELIGKASHLLDDDYIHERFGTVANSLATLVQILTLDSWSETPRYIQERSEKMSYILLVWALYVLFILLAPLMMLNCLNAIFVEGVVTKITHKKLERLRAEVRAKQLVAEELHVVFDKLDKDGDGRVTAAELDAALADSIVTARVRNLGLKRHHLEGLFRSSDDNGDGVIDCLEFMRGLGDLLNIPLSRKDIVDMAARQSEAAQEEPRRAMNRRMNRLDQKLDAVMDKLELSEARERAARKYRVEELDDADGEEAAALADAVVGAKHPDEVEDDALVKAIATTRKSLRTYARGGGGSGGGSADSSRRGTPRGGEGEGEGAGARRGRLV